MQMTAKPIIVGITGASGSVYGLRVLDALAEMDVPSHLVMSKAAELTLSLETDWAAHEFRERATVVHKVGDIGATIASGSVPMGGMIIAPCSIKTMSEIATGVTGNLISRAADVTLKERRPLVLMVREAPFHLGHLRTMTALAEMGATICPPVPAFYTRPQTVQDLVDQSVARALAGLGLSWSAGKVWQPPHHQND